MQVVYNFEVCNKNTRQEMEEKYARSIGSHHNFTDGILHNSYFKKKLLEMYQYTCPFCGLPIKDPSNINLHHVDYDNKCVYYQSECLLLEVPGKNGKIRKYRVPDCEKCHSEHPGRFARCLSLIVPVHHRCHMRIHDLW